MSGVYSVDDLLKLRASPLICRPPNLPPTEEWMGSQEPATKRHPNSRGRQEDGALQTEGFQKRPALDPSHRKSTTDPERLVLGPPRRSFASSSGRPFGKSGALETEDGQRPGHERDKQGDELDSKPSDRRSINTGTINGRFGGRSDQDGSYSRRRHDDEEGDTRPRREHERVKWGAREVRDDKALEENIDENGNSRSGFRRDQGRSRFEQPWFRSDKGDAETRQDNVRGSGHRRDRVRDGDWDMPSKNDVDPEWLDSIDNAEPAQAHTQEDFQRWKERMKAGSAATETRAEPMSIEHTTVTETKPASVPLSGLISPDNSMDKFFAKFNEKIAVTDDKTASKPATKTRFASIFGPQPEVKPEPTPPLPVMAPQTITSPEPPISQPPILQPPNHVDADQAGFQRILQMLGKKGDTGSDAQKSKTPVHSTGPHSHQRNASPDLVALFKQDQPARQTPVSQASMPPGFERVLDSRSPGEGQGRQVQTPNKDELLLNLLRQVDRNSKPPQQHTQPPYNEQRPPPGFFGLPETNRNGNRSMSEVEMPAMQQRDKGRSLFDDSAISSTSYQDEMRVRTGGQRRPTNGAISEYDESYLDGLRSNVRPEKSMPGPQSLPPGLQRPPGLDQMARPPPGWDQQQRGPPQARQGPPPGLPRGMPAPYTGSQQPPMIPMPQQMSSQGPQRGTQRKYTGESTMPNFPPGMGPPPGFMAGGPLPNFHHGSAAGVAQSYGRYAMGGGEQPSQQQPPSNMNRAFMEMYGNGDRTGLRGGHGGLPLPPGYR